MEKNVKVPFSIIPWLCSVDTEVYGRFLFYLYTVPFYYFGQPEKTMINEEHTPKFRKAGIPAEYGGHTEIVIKLHALSESGLPATPREVAWEVIGKRGVQSQDQASISDRGAQIAGPK